MTDQAQAHPPAAGTDGLPVPRRTRWQPLRAGLTDLFYYDYQEFWFRDGRLMLRGNNGTGKSKVLALTLPFLLDADLSPSRVEPDGDRDKKMEWNLLLGSRYDERVGYTWLEFGRRTEDGEHAYFTVGCGLKAVTGRGIADRWYFTTSQRIGADLFLIGASGTVLTRDRLTSAVGEYGMVTQRAETYRRAVDEHLFHLGPDRYASLVDLLVQLRQPQLSRRPDEGKLSRALSEALTPVDQSVIADIATAFHDLEQQRDELAALNDTRHHITRFGQRYQHYARVAARRQGRELRAAQSAYEQTGRDLVGVRDEIRTALAAETSARDELRDAREELTELDAAREELAGRPELASLEHAERLAEATAGAASRENTRKDDAERASASRASQHELAVQEAGRTRGLVTGAAAEAASAASSAGLHAPHAALTLPLDLPDGMSEPQVSTAEQGFMALAERRDKAVAHVLTLARTALSREQEAAGARARLSELEGERDAAADAHRDAEDGVASAAGALAGAWRDYATGLAELELPLPDETGLAEWAMTLSGPNPAESALRSAVASATQALAQAHAQATAHAGTVAAGLDSLAAERRRLEAGETATPPVPYTRADGVRAERPGAPLWRLTEYVGTVGEVQQAGLEAALEASGLLDAWVTPDGTLLDPGTHDVVLTAAPAAEGAAGQAAGTLADVLRPAIDPADETAAQVSAGTVLAVLRMVALRAAADSAGGNDDAWTDGTGTGGAGLPGVGGGRLPEPAWVSPDGRWQVGPLRGAWAKPAAEYVGAASREQARRRRLAALAAEIDAARATLASAREAVGQVVDRQSALAAEAAAAPGDQGLRDAHSRASAARESLDKAAGRLGRQADVVREAGRKAAEATAQRDEAGADLHLPVTVAELQAAGEAVQNYRTAAHQLATRLWQHQPKLSGVATCAAELARAREELRAAEAAAAEAGQTARDSQARLDALRSSIGATAGELRERLAATKVRIAGLRESQRAFERSLTEHSEKRAKLQGKAEQLQSGQAAEQARRDAAVAAFWRFAGTGLLKVALPEVDITSVLPAAAHADPVSAAPLAGPARDEPAAPAVRLARHVEQELASIDDSDEVWRRVQDDIGRRHSELAEALSRHGHHSALSLVDERVVVTIDFQGKDRAPGELAALLDEEVAYRERMLTARERELIEEHLVNDVASHLQELISDAESQVEQMNAELAERPTSTGMRLRLRWEASPDGPPGLPEARRRLLRQDAELWSAADRAAVGEFLQAQVEAERAKAQDSTWQEHLRLALDYRSWHRFVIERFQDGRWRPQPARRPEVNGC